MTEIEDGYPQVPQWNAVIAGRFRPIGGGLGVFGMPEPAPQTNDWGTELAVFSGSNPNGTWQLFVQDNTDAAARINGGWSIKFFH